MTKYFYMKLLGLLLVVLGFSYCMTSFYNFYGYLFGEVTIAGENVYIMTSGLIIPLYVFIFGVYFYFYSDRDFSRINPFIIISGIVLVIVGVIRFFIQNMFMHFIHISFAYILIILGIMIIVGCIRYKY